MPPGLCVCQPPRAWVDPSPVPWVCRYATSAFPPASRAIEMLNPPAPRLTGWADQALPVIVASMGVRAPGSVKAMTGPLATTRMALLEVGHRPHVRVEDTFVVFQLLPCT